MCGSVELCERIHLLQVSARVGLSRIQRPLQAVVYNDVRIECTAIIYLIVSWILRVRFLLFQTGRTCFPLVFGRALFNYAFIRVLASRSRVRTQQRTSTGSIVREKFKFSMISINILDINKATEEYDTFKSPRFLILWPSTVAVRPYQKSIGKLLRFQKKSARNCDNSETTSEKCDSR
jgi:hypothetical protein